MVRRQWDPEWPVSSELAASLVATQFPGLAPVSVEEFGEGWDNTVYLVNDAIVFRFPRRAAALPLIETEIRLLPWLAPRLPLAIPVPEYVGFPSGAYPCRFAGYPLIPGVAASEADLDDASRTGLAAPLAVFLSALHGLPVEEAKAHGAPVDPISRMDVRNRGTHMNRRIETLRTAGAPIDPDTAGRLDAIVGDVPDSFRARHDTLIHGDLHSSQLLVDRDGTLVGVIDWGDACVGDPASDLMAVHANLPGSAHEAFLDVYGPVDPAAWAAARARAAWHTVALLDHAVDTGNARRVADGLAALARLLR